MKKRLKLIVIVGFLLHFLIPAYAEEPVEVIIPISVNGNEQVEITAVTPNAPLPAETLITIEETGEIRFLIDDVGTYEYEVKQIPSQEELIYDETVWGVQVYVARSGEEKYVVLSTYRTGEDEKLDEINFHNEPIPTPTPTTPPETTPTPPSTPTPTPTPTVTPSPTPTPTPSPTMTPMVSPSPTPSDDKTPIPSITPSPSLPPNVSPTPPPSKTNPPGSPSIPYTGDNFHLWTYIAILFIAIGIAISGLVKLKKNK